MRGCFSVLQSACKILDHLIILWCMQFETQYSNYYLWVKYKSIRCGREDLRVVEEGTSNIRPYNPNAVSTHHQRSTVSLQTHQTWKKVALHVRNLPPTKWAIKEGIYHPIRPKTIPLLSSVSLKIVVPPLYHLLPCPTGSSRPQVVPFHSL